MNKKKYSKEEADERNRASKRRSRLRNPEKSLAQSTACRNRMRVENRLFIREYKENHPCRCGESSVCCLDFHHLDSSVKERNVSALSKSPVSSRRLKKEIEKCIVICSNCHRKLHNGELEYEIRDIL